MLSVIYDGSNTDKVYILVIKKAPFGGLSGGL